MLTQHPPAGYNRPAGVLARAARRRSARRSGTQESVSLAYMIGGGHRMPIGMRRAAGTTRPRPTMPGKSRGRDAGHGLVSRFVGSGGQPRKTPAVPAQVPAPRVNRKVTWPETFQL